MTTKLNSYIHFDGNARDAMEFYRSIFGGEVLSSTYGESASDDMPVDETMADKFMHAHLHGGNIELMGSDMPDSANFAEGSRVTLSINSNDEAELRGYWEKLSQDAQVHVPLDRAPWGDIFGMLTDKFGVNWMVNIAP